jgi:hypothetical protein
MLVILGNFFEFSSLKKLVFVVVFCCPCFLVQGLLK